MSPGAEAQNEEAERLRPLFDAQLRFAEALSASTARPLADTCLEFTNLHRRFGLGRVGQGAPSPQWTRFADGLARCASQAERLDWTVAFFAASPVQESATRRFGCFSYELAGEGDIVRIHFSSRDGDDVSPLAHARVDRRLADLRAMFADIRDRHPGARTVRGGSWLYNLEAYRRLFPTAYAASVFTPERVRLDGTSSWGQLLDFRGSVKPAARQALLDALPTLDPAAPWTAFPLRALGAEAPIEAFHETYGC